MARVDRSRPSQSGPSGRQVTGRKADRQHIGHAGCLPEICTLDCGTMSFAEGDYVMTNTPGILRDMGAWVIGPSEVREKLGLTRRAPN